MSNNCNAYTLAGLMQDCSNSKGGIKKVLIATEDPKPISTSEPIDLNLSWFGCAIVKDGDKYVYSEDIINPNDSTSIKVYKGDVIEFVLNINENQTAEIAIGESYGAGKEILELKSFNVSKQHNKIRLKIGEDFGKSITDEGYLSIHLGVTGEPTGSKAYNIKELGKIVNFDNNVAWYEYNFKKNTGSFTSTLNVDPANSVNFVSTELTLQFNKMNTVKRVEMAALAVNEMYIIVQDCNNTYWYLGADDSCVATSGSSQTGTNKNDGNFYQIVITDESKTWPLEVLKDAVPIGKITLQGWSGLTLSSAVKSDNAVVIVEGELKFGNTIKLRANVSWQQKTLWDKDKQIKIGPDYMGTGEITLDDPNRTVYNIAVIGR